MLLVVASLNVLDVLQASWSGGVEGRTRELAERRSGDVEASVACDTCHRNQIVAGTPWLTHT